jgi:hypothetical protein
MKLIAIFSLAILSSNSKVFAQNGNEKIFSLPDTVYRYQGIIPPVEFQYDLNQFFQQPLAKQIPDDVLFTEDRSTIWLKTELLIAKNSYLSNKVEFNTHFTSPLHQQFIKDSEFDMVRYVLGMAQLSAVAYMAYRHIKKYGFLK